MKLISVLQNIVKSGDTDDIILFMSIYYTSLAYPAISQDFEALQKIMNNTVENTTRLLETDVPKEKLGLFEAYVD